MNTSSQNRLTVPRGRLTHVPNQNLPIAWPNFSTANRGRHANLKHVPLWSLVRYFVKTVGRGALCGVLMFHNRPINRAGE